MKTIYDIGANNGDDIPYYLLKSDKVVAIEANPKLCEEISIRFCNEIKNGSLVVENCVVTTTHSKHEKFYIHNSNHVLSQFPKPEQYSLHEFSAVTIQSKNILDIITTHGKPHYIKIDIEGYDHILLKHLFENGIFPAYISAEAHNIDVFCYMVTSEQYNLFKLVDGRTVHSKYKNCTISTKNKTTTYSFPKHSAGPFADDISGYWLNKNDFFELLGESKLGWKDIHASHINNSQINEKQYYKNGQVAIEYPYYAGQLHGCVKQYFDDGQLYIETPYHLGKESGVEKRYYQSGAIMAEINYLNGKKHGDEIWFFENGQLRSHTNFIDGKEHGLAQYYFESGQLKEKIHYNNGKIDSYHWLIKKLKFFKRS